MDIKKFVLLDWVEKDLLLIMKRVSTTDNYSDSLTKPFGRIQFHKHSNYILGKMIPKFTSFFKQYNGTQMENPKGEEKNTPSIEINVLQKTWGG